MTRQRSFFQNLWSDQWHDSLLTITSKKIPQEFAEIKYKMA